MVHVAFLYSVCVDSIGEIVDQMFGKAKRSNAGSWLFQGSQKLLQVSRGFVGSGRCLYREHGDHHTEQDQQHRREH